MRDELSAFSKITWLLPTISPMSICQRKQGYNQTTNKQDQGHHEILNIKMQPVIKNVRCIICTIFWFVFCYQFLWMLSFSLKGMFIFFTNSEFEITFLLSLCFCLWRFCSSRLLCFDSCICVSFASYSIWSVWRLSGLHAMVKKKENQIVIILTYTGYASTQIVKSLPLDNYCSD